MAMCTADGLDPDHQSNDDVDEGARLWTTYLPLARAAIAAMEVPTEEMVEAGQSMVVAAAKDLVPEVWSKMCRAALKEEK